MSALRSPFLLGPKHAQFHVQITLNEVTNVPLLTGDLGVAWKMQHTVSHSSRKASGGAAGFLDAAEPTNALHIKTNAPFLRGDDGMVQSPGTMTPVAPLSPRLHPRASPSGDAPVLPAQAAGSNASVRSFDSAGEAVPGLARTATDGASGRGRHLRDGSEPRWHRQRASSFSSRSFSMAGPNVYTEPKGQTPYEKVHQHTVKLGAKIETVLRMSIGRLDAADRDEDESTRTADSAYGFLAPSRVRFRVLRSTTGKQCHGEDAASLGYVEINLAEYAPAWNGHQGASEWRTEARQYLLDDCMANTMLRITIDMRFVDGSQAYRVPPIQRGIAHLTSLKAHTDSSGGGTPRTGPSRQNTAEAERTPVHDEIMGEPSDERTGLEWHYKLPMSIHFYTNAVRDELIHKPSGGAAQESDAAPVTACEPAGPRMMYCDTSTEELINGLFSGQLGLAGDGRNDVPDSVHKHHSLARQQWDRMVRTAGHANNPANRTPRAASHTMPTPHAHEVAWEQRA